VAGKNARSESGGSFVVVAFLNDRGRSTVPEQRQSGGFHGLFVEARLRFAVDRLVNQCSGGGGGIAPEGASDSFPFRVRGPPSLSEGVGTRTIGERVPRAACLNRRTRRQRALVALIEDLMPSPVDREAERALRGRVVPAPTPVFRTRAWLAFQRMIDPLSPPGTLRRSVNSASGRAPRRVSPSRLISD